LEQLKQLKAEIEKEAKSSKSVDWEALLLKEPTPLKSSWTRLPRTEKLSTNGEQNSVG
jgi:hypothetical protein